MVLSLALLQKAQAEAEGFQNGPAPALNAANLNTQDAAGNPQTPTSSPTPYYPSSETPNLQLSTEDMSSQLANNFVILDSLVGNVPVISERLQVLNATSAQSLVATAPATQMYAVSLYMSAAGTATAGHTVVATINYTCELGPETITVVLPLDVDNIIMETYPLLCIGGTTVSFTTAYGGGATNDPYNISARLVQMP
jgi:hypothetical protein